MAEDNLDFNDQMFEINNHNEPQVVPFIGNDSDIGSSVSNFGIDRDNPEENRQYIQQNQDLRVIIQGVGVASISTGNSPLKESGLGDSVSRSRNSELIPEIIEYETDDIPNAALNETDEPQPGPSNGIHHIPNDNEYLEDLDISPFDLALERGYRDQAKMYYDTTASQGLKFKTKHITLFKDIKAEKADNEKNIHIDPEDELISEKFNYQFIFMLKKDFEGYLENIENNNYKKVLNRISDKTSLNAAELKISKNIKTKEKRNDLNLKKETIKIIKDYLQLLDDFEDGIKKGTREICLNGKNDLQAPDIGSEEPKNEDGCKPNQENSTSHEDDSYKDGPSRLNLSL